MKQGGPYTGRLTLTGIFVDVHPQPMFEVRFRSFCSRDPAGIQYLQLAIAQVVYVLSASEDL